MCPRTPWYQMAARRPSARSSGGSGRLTCTPRTTRSAVQAATAASKTSSGLTRRPVNPRSPSRTIPAFASRRRRRSNPAQVVLGSGRNRPASVAKLTSGWTSTTCQPTLATHSSTSPIFGPRANACWETPSPRHRTACSRAFTRARSNPLGSNGPPTQPRMWSWSSCNGSASTRSSSS